MKVFSEVANTNKTFLRVIIKNYITSLTSVSSMPKPDGLLLNQFIISVRVIVGAGNGFIAVVDGDVLQSGLPPTNSIFCGPAAISIAVIPAICHISALDMS